jgi:predicted Rossmann fold nucleotide-binding protein DprA/Smf involved in DNA uptake
VYNFGVRRELSPLARVVLNVLRVAPATADELALETKLPPAVLDAALAELVNAGRVLELEPRRFVAR